MYFLYAQYKEDENKRSLLTGYRATVAAMIEFIC